MTYRHKQFGYWILAIVSAPIAASVAISLVTNVEKDTMTIVLLSLLIPLAAGFVFSTMSTAVDDDAVSWHFTGGIAKGRMPLEAIVSVTIVNLPWFYGWGIRFTPRGTLYRVGGKSAVELVTDKKRINLGSDDAEGLAAAIRVALASANG